MWCGLPHGSKGADARLTGRLRRMRRNGGEPCGPRVLLFALLPAKFLLEPASSVSVAADSMGRSRFEEPVPYRVAGGAASGGRLWRMGIDARRGSLRRHSTRPLAMLPVLPRMDVSLQRLASAGRILARSSDLGPLRCLFWPLRVLALRGAPTRCIYHRQARALRSSPKKPCSSWSSSARSPPRHSWRMHRW